MTSPYGHRRNPYREAPIRSTIACVESVARKTELDDPESIGEYVATTTVSDNRKCILVDAIARYYDFKQIEFEKPIYGKIRKLPFIPLEQKVDELVSGAHNTTATFLAHPSRLSL